MVEFVLRRYRNYSQAHRWSFVLSALLAFAAAIADAQTQRSFTEQGEARVLALVNDFRSQHGLHALEGNARLTDAARYFAGYMGRTARLEHDADGNSPAERARERGYEYCIIAENIAYEYSSRGFSAETLAKNLLKGWVESPPHRASMLEPDVTQTGVAIAAGSKSGEYYAVQMFGRPASERVRFRVTNRTGRTIRYEYRNRTVTLPAKQIRTHQSCVPGELKLVSGNPQRPVRPGDGDRFEVTESERGVILLPGR